MESLTVAWRNLWRNRTRTGITLASVTLNTAVLIVAYALLLGMLDQLERNAIQLYTGDVQVHAEGYRRDRSIYKTVAWDDRLAKLESQGLYVAPRLYGYGLVSSGRKSAGASFWGVSPAAEKKGFALAGQVSPGRYLTQDEQNGVVLGKALAKTLKTKVGDELVVIVQGADGSIGSELYTIAGILKGVGDEVDRGVVIMHERDFRVLFTFPEGEVHEVAFNSHGVLEVEAVSALARLHYENDEVATWMVLNPLLSEMLELMDGIIWIYGAIFFIAAGIGVTNTMLMSTYDRLTELGVLKALGTPPWRIVAGITVEALLLALVATAAGAALGIAAALYLEVNGIDVGALAGGSFSFNGMAFDPIWRGVLTPGGVVYAVIVMCGVCVLAALYPALLAARLNPVETLHNA